MPARVLIADDEAAVLRILTRILRSLGYEVVAVDSGRGALAHALSTPVDVFLTDLRMPGWNGIETYQHMRTMLPIAPPAILLTAASDGPALALASGMSFVPKPCGADELREAVAMALARGTARRDSS